MDPKVVGAVNRYIDETLDLTDSALAEALRDAADAGLPDINIGPEQGRLLQLLALSVGARRILEIGTLAGYSTIWLARGLVHGGRVISLEIDPYRAKVALTNLERAGLSGVADVRVGAAIDTLRELAAETAEPFDLFFLDADEPSYVDYLDACLELARVGSLIIADNLVRDGALADPETKDPRAQGARRYMERLAADPRLVSTLVPFMGETNYDGMSISRIAHLD
jgi:predicted O-methyltransferase YrrM